MADENQKRNPYEDLADYLRFCLNLGPGSPNVVISKIVEVLEQHGVRIALVAVHDDWTHPQVELTATLDDVTAKTVAQVVDPILRKAGIPEHTVLMLASMAGGAIVRALHNHTNQPARRRYATSRSYSARGVGHNRTRKS